MVQPGLYNTLLGDLDAEVKILHLIYHQNKNQHRLNKWWKFVSILHRRGRQVLRLLKSDKQANTEEKWSKLARFMFHKLIPAAYTAFHGILKLSQFVALGFALLAVLARFRDILRQLLGVADHAVKPRNVVESSTKNSTKVASNDASKNTRESISLPEELEDYGVTIAREEIEQRIVEIADDPQIKVTNVKASEAQVAENTEMKPKLSAPMKKQSMERARLKDKKRTGVQKVNGEKLDSRKNKKKSKNHKNHKNVIDAIFGS